ncbi:MAG: type II secretion system F family protein [Actinobacteria bacterium]|jgi:type IV pilus assembly protein PilC|nr:type II secretion system F family protein [Actinomycetota bacterium]
MALTFDYKVRDQSGKLVEGSLEGDSLPLVISRLREMGYLPVSVTEAGSKGMKTEIVIPGLSDRIKPKEVAMFSRQFATMVDSGLSISRSLAVLSTQMENKYLAAKIREIRDDVESGATLSSALAKHPKVFDNLYVSMIQAGEIGGSIDTVLKSTSEQLEKAVELRRKIKGAMTYPIIVLSVIGIIVLVMMVAIVPIFKNLFKTLGGTLPGPTQAVIAISNTLLSWKLLVVIAVVVAFIIAFRRWIKTEKGRLIWDGFKLKPPIFGPLAHKAAMTRFASTLSSLLSSGVPVLEALDITANAADNVIVANAVRATKTGVREGKPFAEPMKEHDIFPNLVIQMVEVGEQTGALDEMLQRVADFYSDEVDQTVDNLTSILEPLLVVVMGVVVGSVIISLYLPMFDYIKLLKS